jgi:hypothetical protein
MLAMPSSECLNINKLLEWRTSRDREEFRTSELCLRLHKALAIRSWSQEVACLLPNWGAYHSRPPDLFSTNALRGPDNLLPCSLRSGDYLLY